MELIDTHAHLDHEQFAGEEAEVLQRARAAGVVQVITIGSDLATSRRAIELAETYPEVYATVGIHPHDAASADDDAFRTLASWAAHPRVVAIGEIGLDFHYDFSPRDVQRDVFRRQLRLAGQMGLPVVIHDREAHDAVMEVLEEAWAAEEEGSGPPCPPVVLHSFTGTWEMAARCLEKGCYLSIGGMVTFKNAAPIRDVFRRVPADRLLLETDAPYLSPEPFRGRRNEPARVRVVAEFLAALRGEDVENLAAQTTANARRFFRLPSV